MERSTFFGATRFDAGSEAGSRKDFEGAREIEDLNVVEDKNAGVKLLRSHMLGHDFLCVRRFGKIV